MWCGGNQEAEVRECVNEECMLYGYRMGHNPPDKAMTALKAIRLRCIDCVGSQRLVNRCGCPECALYVYRNGKNPKQAGRKGNTEALQNWHKKQMEKRGGEFN